jgi:hypothetical protein
MITGGERRVKDVQTACAIALDILQTRVWRPLQAQMHDTLDYATTVSTLGVALRLLRNVQEELMRLGGERAS